MTKIVVVTSGKGGVGKTTTSASFASGLALRGHKTAVIDFDVGLRNLDLIMGCERRVVYDLINVIHGEANLHQALIVTNPEVSSVRDSDRILGMLGSKTKRAIEGKDAIKEHLLITRYNPTRVQGGQMLSLDDIQEILRIPLIGVIPESESVLDASNQGLPAVHLKGTDVSEAYQDVISRFLGEDKPLRFIDAEKPGFFKRLFGSK